MLSRYWLSLCAFARSRLDILVWILVAVSAYGATYYWGSGANLERVGHSESKPQCEYAESQNKLTGKRGNQTFLTVVCVNATSDANENSSEKSEEYKLKGFLQDSRRLAKKSSDDPLIILTFLLAVSTILLWRETSRLAKDAKESSDAAIAIELPVIRATKCDLIGVDKPIPEDGPFGGSVHHRAPTKYSATSAILFKNFGRSNALPIIVGLGWRVADRLPDQPVYTKTIGVNHGVVLIPDKEKPDSQHSAEISASIELTDTERTAINTGAEWLWVYGFMRYTDFMGKVRDARFCFRYANRNSGSRPYWYLASDGNPPKAYTSHAEAKN